MASARRRPLAGAEVAALDVDRPEAAKRHADFVMHGTEAMLEDRERLLE